MCITFYGRIEKTPLTQLACSECGHFSCEAHTFAVFSDKKGCPQTVCVHAVCMHKAKLAFPIYDKEIADRGIMYVPNDPREEGLRKDLNILADLEAKNQARIVSWRIAYPGEPRVPTSFGPQLP